MIRSTIEKWRYRLGWHGAPELRYVSPGVNWVLDWVSYYITREVEAQFGLKAKVVSTAKGQLGQIIHFGSLWDLTANISRIKARSNFSVGTIFHGQREDAAFADALEKALAIQGDIFYLHTASEIMKNRLKSWGVPEDELVLIPLGVDLDKFKPVMADQRARRRTELGIPEQAFCIGSFQKDGIGMQDGSEPKLIKGPDVFLKIVERVAKHKDIFVLLSGPARGYIRRNLEAMNIPHKHLYFDDFFDIPQLYEAIDMYLLTSREEGGPQAVLESQASGVPLVATSIGLTPDVVTTEVNGLLGQSEDVETLVKHVMRLADQPELRTRLAAAGIERAKEYDWPLIAARYYTEIYKPILDSTSK